MTTDTPEDPQKVAYLRSSDAVSEGDAGLPDIDPEIAQPSATSKAQFANETNESPRWIRRSLTSFVVVIVIGAAVGAYLLYKRFDDPLRSPSSIQMNVVASNIESLSPPAIAVDQPASESVATIPVAYPVSQIQLVSTTANIEPFTEIDTPELPESAELVTYSQSPSVETVADSTHSELPIDYRLLEQGLTRIVSVTEDHETKFADLDSKIAELTRQIEMLRELQMTTSPVQPVAMPLEERVVSTPVASVQLDPAPVIHPPALASIRVFGSVVSVRIVVNDQSQSMAIGDAKDGWRLNSVDVQSGRASFSHIGSDKEEVVYL